MNLILMIKALHIKDMMDKTLVLGNDLILGRLFTPPAQFDLNFLFKKPFIKGGDGDAILLNLAKEVIVT